MIKNIFQGERQNLDGSVSRWGGRVEMKTLEIGAADGTAR